MFRGLADETAEEVPVDVGLQSTGGEEEGFRLNTCVARFRLDV